MTVAYIHLRAFTFEGAVKATGGNTIAFSVTPFDGLIQVTAGLSKVHPRDNYNKNHGRRVAERRRIDPDSQIKFTWEVPARILYKDKDDTWVLPYCKLFYKDLIDQVKTHDSQHVSMFADLDISSEDNLAVIS